MTTKNRNTKKMEVRLRKQAHKELTDKCKKYGLERDVIGGTIIERYMDEYMEFYDELSSRMKDIGLPFDLDDEDELQKGGCMTYIKEEKQGTKSVYYKITADENGKELSRRKVEINDLLYNLMFDGKRLKVVDTFEFRKGDITYLDNV